MGRHRKVGRPSYVNKKARARYEREEIRKHYPSTGKTSRRRLRRNARASHRKGLRWTDNGWNQ